MITRGVLLDVPKHRGEPYVTFDKPVHGWELGDIARAEGITLEPRDAVCVYSGREALQADHPGRYYEPSLDLQNPERPGLHASCLPFLRDHDIATASKPDSSGDYPCIAGLLHRARSRVATRPFRAPPHSTSDAGLIGAATCRALRPRSTSVSAHGRIHKVVHTISDLDAAETISSTHLSEAIQYRTPDRQP